MWRGPHRCGCRASRCRNTSRSVTSFRIVAWPVVRKLLLHKVSPEVKQQRRAELERPAVHLVVRLTSYEVP
jgi:hypothetical protein